MNLSDIVKILQNKYNISITQQALYNWCKKFDLLKYRGKGRNLSRQGQVQKIQSPHQKKMEEYRKIAQERKKQMRGRR